MKKALQLFGLVFIVIAIFTMSSCDKEPIRKTFPFSADIFHSLVEKQAAFTALTHSAVSWSWDFGDGNTSMEQNPVHVYADGGYYTVTLTVTDSGGNTEVAEEKLAVALTPYILLTGGPTSPNGKTWKLSASHSANDYFANADADLSLFEDTPKPLPTGVFDLLLGMGEVYDDEFTFHFDGSYSQDVKEDGAAFGGIVYQVVTNGGVGIVNANGQDFGLCTGLYSPEVGATFTYVEAEDFTVSSVYNPPSFEIIYSNVSTLDFTGTEFVGFMDFQRKVIVQEIKDNSMRLVMFMAAGQEPAIIGINTHALILTFEVVK